MKRALRAIALCSALCLFAGTNSACFGSFKLVRGVWGWNKGASGSKWVQWLVFLGLTVIPVYALASLGDVLIFNSIEFWGGGGGDVDLSDARNTARDRWIRVSDREEIHLRKSEDGKTLRAEVLKDGVPVSRFSLERTDKGMVLKSAEGQVLGKIRDGADGSLVLVEPGTGRVTTFDRKRVEAQMSELAAL